MALQEELELQGNYLFKYRGSLPIVILIISLIVFIRMQFLMKELDYVINYNLIEFIGLFFSFVGIVIRAYTVGYSAKNTSGRNTKEQVADELNNTGIYSMVRHPLYVGNFFMWLGPAILVQNILFIVIFISLYWVYYERIMFAEEQFLRKKFGNIYLKWAEKTPAFIPSFKNYMPAKEKFSWKKLIKKEKNGFAATFLIFFIFRMIREFIHNKSFGIDTWVFYAMLSSLALYLVLKILKKHTNVFEDGR